MSPFFYEILFIYLDLKKIIDVFKKKFITCDYHIPKQQR